LYYHLKIESGAEYMDIKEFISNFKNHPVLFVGAGMSLRYINNSYSWDGLLKKIAHDLTGNDEFFYDVKSKYEVQSGVFNYQSIASDIEIKFNETLIQDRYGKFKNVNDKFYKQMSKNINVSRFKIYISELLKDMHYKNESEIDELRKARKNISSIITTNYDTLLE